MSLGCQNVETIQIYCTMSDTSRMYTIFVDAKIHRGVANVKIYLLLVQFLRRYEVKLEPMTNAYYEEHMKKATYFRLSTANGSSIRGHRDSDTDFHTSRTLHTAQRTRDGKNWGIVGSPHRYHSVHGPSSPEHVSAASDEPATRGNPA